MEDGLAIAINSALADGESLDLAGQGLARRIPAELTGAQLLALQPGPDFYKLGLDLWLLAAAGLGQGGELVLLVAQDPFELEVFHHWVARMEGLSQMRQIGHAPKTKGRPSPGLPMGRPMRSSLAHVGCRTGLASGNGPYPLLCRRNLTVRAEDRRRPLFEAVEAFLVRQDTLGQNVLVSHYPAKVDCFITRSLNF